MSKLKRIKRAKSNPKRAAEKRLPELRWAIAPKSYPSRLALLRSFDGVVDAVSEYLFSVKEYGLCDEWMHERINELFLRAGTEEAAERGTSYDPSDFSTVSAIEFCMTAHAIWRTEGSVEISLSRDVVISLLLTASPDPSSIAEEEQRRVFPWNCFKIRFPEGVIPARGGSSLKSVLAVYNSDSKKVTVVDDRFYLDGADASAFEGDGSLTPHTEEQCEAAATIANNLMLILSTEPNAVQYDSHESMQQSVKRGTELAHLPTPNVYSATPGGIWGDPALNQRAYEAIRSGSDFKALTWFRRGHWRMQRVGEGRTDRRRVRVAPSWCHRHGKEVDSSST